jgi:hypothetical protein
MSAHHSFSAKDLKRVSEGVFKKYLQGVEAMVNRQEEMIATGAPEGVYKEYLLRVASTVNKQEEKKAAGAE